MPNIEKMELESYRGQLETDVKRLVDKYLAISEWDVPGIDEPRAKRLIIAATRRVLDCLEDALPESPTARAAP